MKSKYTKRLEDKFNMPKSIDLPEEMKQEILDVKKNSKALMINSDFYSDSEKVKKNIRSILERCDGILEGLTFLALDSESPRAYEVLANTIRIIVESNEKMLDIHKKIYELENKHLEQSGGEGGNQYNKNYFFGNPDEFKEKYKDRLNDRQ